MVQSATYEELLAATGWFGCDDSEKLCDFSFGTIMAAPKEVSVDPAITSVISELKNISSLKEEQRTALKAFFDGKDVFALSRLASARDHVVC